MYFIEKRNVLVADVEPGILTEARLWPCWSSALGAEQPTRRMT